MRACLETQKLEQLEGRMDEIADRVARDRTNAARERTTHPRSRAPFALSVCFHYQSIRQVFIGIK